MDCAWGAAGLDGGGIWPIGPPKMNAGISIIIKATAFRMEPPERVEMMRLWYHVFDFNNPFAL